MRCFARLALAAAIPLLTLAPLSPAWAQDAAREPQIPQLEIERYTLPNGLEVILHQDSTTPVVAVDVWYKVGSKDEVKGRTGFAHLFEHLMFQGSLHHDNEYFGPLEELGANINGSTNTDRTNYFEVVPSNALERALWLEADRMGFLLPALTQEKLDNQRDVVKNERRQRVDNVPYGQAMERMLEAMYPPGHPYHHSVIGSLADLSAASLEDVKNFFRTYYNPNNASLVVAGDFDIDEAKGLIEKYFGPIAAGPKVEPPPVRVPTLEESKHETMTDRVALARTQLAWPTVEAGADDEPALDVLASILGQLDKENRLYRVLMYDAQRASSVFAYHSTSQLAGGFTVQITARPGEELDELIALADAEIERIIEDGVTEDEVAKAQTSTESSQIIRLQSALAKAELLNSGNVYYGNPLAYQDELKALFAVTPEDVQRVAKQYLTGNRVRLDVTPGPQAERKPDVPVDDRAQVELVAEDDPVNDDFDRSIMPEPGPTPDFTPPPVQRRKLSNGLEVLVAERHELPVLTLNLVVKGGSNLEPQGKESLANMMAALLSEGTEELDSLELAGALSEIGASLSASSGQESSNLALTTLTKHTERALDLFTDVLLNPAFPEKELERLRKEMLAALLRRADSPTAIAGIVLPKLLYSEIHPYGRIDTVGSVGAITRDDVLALHKSLFLPNNAALIVVGDTTPDAIVAALETEIEGWKAGAAPEVTYPEPPSSRPLTVYLVDKPGAAQSVLSVGQVGVPRKTPDYFPLTVMNAILGGQFSSRINLNLREDKGYTYGARSSFEFAQGPGPFSAGGSVQTEVTKPALIELMKELDDITGPRPVSEAELTFAKERLIRGFPSRFETTFGVAGQLEDLVLFDLPNDYFTNYQSEIEQVAQDDVTRVASKYLDPENMIVLIVGDRAKVEPELKSLPYAEVINALDPEGNPLPTPAAVSGETLRDIK